MYAIVVHCRGLDAVSGDGAGSERGGSRNVVRWFFGNCIISGRATRARADRQNRNNETADARRQPPAAAGSRVLGFPGSRGVAARHCCRARNCRGEGEKGALNYYRTGDIIRR